MTTTGTPESAARFTQAVIVRLCCGSEDDALRAGGDAAIHDADLLDRVALPQRAIEDDSDADTLFSQQVIGAAAPRRAGPIASARGSGPSG